jgi:hypothetical protein
VSTAITVAVECYSGYTFAERPIAFTWGSQRYQIERISKRWRSPDGPGFRVITADGAQFDLTFSEARDEWSLHLPPGERWHLQSRTDASVEVLHSSDPDRKERETDA